MITNQEPILELLR